jgi:hypothetical protein
MIKIVKSQLIEVVLPGIAGGGNPATTIQFPDQPYLRFRRVFGIEVFTSADVTTSPLGNTPISGAQMMLSFLTLYLTDPQSLNAVGQWIQNVPFSRLHLIQNAVPDPFVRQPYEMVGQKVSWEKCQIILAAPLNNTANVAFLFNVYFEEDPKNPQ